MRSKIIFSRAGVEIVTKPFLVGKPLEKLAQEASADFVRDLLADSEVKLAEPCVSLVRPGGSTLPLGWRPRAPGPRVVRMRG